MLKIKDSCKNLRIKIIKDLSYRSKNLDISGEIDVGLHVHDDVPLDVDFEHGDDGDDATDCRCRRRGLQQ